MRMKDDLENRIGVPTPISSRRKFILAAAATKATVAKEIASGVLSLSDAIGKDRHHVTGLKLGAMHRELGAGKHSQRKI